MRIHELDDASIQLLAHPLRLRLLALLRHDGPATATGLAARVGESSGVTSYHLRKFADGGFVEEDPGRGTKRDRWWRSAHEATKVSPADFLGRPRGPSGKHQRASGDLPLAAAAHRHLVG